VSAQPASNGGFFMGKRPFSPCWLSNPWLSLPTFPAQGERIHADSDRVSFHLNWSYPMKYILAVLVMTFSMQSSADSWLCISDEATGFALKDGSWESALFEVGKKYMIKEADDTGKLFDAVYQVHRFGRGNPSWICGDFGSKEYSE
jgi:hypothetical protein